MSELTRGILQDADRRDWKLHHYGLATNRWELLSARNYWITGAGTGYGRAIAIALAAAGARVFLTGRREEMLHDAIAEARALGASADRCHAVPADVTDPGQVDQACLVIHKRCTALQGMVHCAAAPQRTAMPWPLLQESADYWDDIMRINVKGPWLISRTMLPYMVRGGEVRALFLTSAAGWGFAPGYGHYCISKSALNNFAAALAEECRTRFPDSDIQINALDPGEARTEMNSGATQSPDAVCCMTLTLLSQPAGGPNGKFFCRDGRHLAFCNSLPYGIPLIKADGMTKSGQA